MDNAQKLKHTIDALFGYGVSKTLPKDIEIIISKRTGKIRNVNHNGILLFTPRTDGGLAITRYCAEIFLKNKKFRENCLEIDKESILFLENEFKNGVRIFGYLHNNELIGVIGFQKIKDVVLIRHAYTLTQHQGKGKGSELLKCLLEKNKNKWDKFIIREGNHLRLTEEGYAFADAVAIDLLL